jgi:hypothetical protein
MYMCDTVIVFALFLRFSDFRNALAMSYVLFIILLSTSKSRKCVTRHQVTELVIVEKGHLSNPSAISRRKQVNFQ